MIENFSVGVGPYTRFKDDIGIIVEALSDEIQFSGKHKEFIYDSNLFGESFEEFRGKLFQKIYEIREKREIKRIQWRYYARLQIIWNP